MNTPATWAIAATIAFALAASPLLDAPTDQQAALDMREDAASALRELQASAPKTSRREAAAQKLCLEVRGAESVVRWTPEGHLVCGLSRALSPPITVIHLNPTQKDASL